jgi:hypothetical protein
MNQATRKHTRRKAPFVVLAVVSAVALFGLTQCKLAPDKVTGVEKTEMGKAASAPGNCISDCAHAANDAMKAEQDLHKDNVKACNKNSACLAAEDARHDAAVDQIQDGRKACMNNCHHQGGGNGR